MESPVSDAETESAAPFRPTCTVLPNNKQEGPQGSFAFGEQIKDAVNYLAESEQIVPQQSGFIPSDDSAFTK